MLVEGPVRVVGDNTAFLHELVQGVVVVAGSRGISVDVGENLFDAEVAVAEGCTIVEAQEFFLCTAKVPAPISCSIDEVDPDGACNRNIEVPLRWGINVRGGAKQEW